MAFLGVSSSGTSDLRSAEFANRFSLLMKEDRAECEYFGKSDVLFQDLKIMRATKKASKKFVEGQKQRDQYNQKIRYCGQSQNLDGLLK